MAEKQAAAAPAKKEKKGGKYKYTAATKFCAKCGARMAAHKDRFSCGRCSYTEWKPKDKGQ